MAGPSRRHEAELMWFWMPSREGVFVTYHALERKHTPAGFYVMWCRCDFCGYSGPSCQFEFVWRRGTINACHICLKCFPTPEVQAILANDGWKVG